MGDTQGEIRRPLTAATASIGAGVVHAAAVGVHAEHRSLVVIFAALAVAQVGAGVVALDRTSRSVLTLASLVNVVSVAGWVMTRTSGISFISGLEYAERPQAADSLCALLGLLAVIGFWAALAPTSRRARGSFVPVLGSVALACAGLATIRVHSHSHSAAQIAAESAFVIGPNGELILKNPPTTVAEVDTTVVNGDVTGAGGTEVPVTDTVAPTTTVRRKVATTTTAAPPTTVHTHDTTPAAVLAAASGWPRVWDPAKGLDLFSGVGGVTADQEARARALVTASERDLPHWANYATAIAEGWKSIADNQTSGYEHLVKNSLVNDGKFLDSTAPESLVYKVENGTKTLVSAMYISPTGTSLSDPLLTDYAGPLMQWHIHNNLCFKIGVSGNPVVAGITDVLGNCPANTVKQTDGSPMIHVWIVPHPCGPFAAVEGVAAGTASAPDSQRLDLCKH